MASSASLVTNTRAPGTRTTTTGTTDTEATRGEHFPIQIEEGGDGRVHFAVAACQGFRKGMEDAHAVVLNLEGVKGHSGGTTLFGVFDGHAGKEVAAFCAQHLPALVLAAPSFTSHGSSDLRAALHEAFMSMDGLLKDPKHQAELFAMRRDLPLPAAPDPAKAAQRAQAVAESPAGEAEAHDAYSMARGKEVHAALTGPDVKKHAAGYGTFTKAGQYLGPRAGSTALVALLRPGQLVVGHVGDSRCVLSKGGAALALTHDHKPQQSGEQARILAAGEVVAPQRPGMAPRVGGTLAMSRAMGDVMFKANHEKGPEEQAVIAVPETKEVHLHADHDFMVLACDGVWDVMSADDVVLMVRGQLQEGNSLGRIAHNMVDRCLSHRTSRRMPSMDNLTFMLVVFSEAMKGSATRLA